MINIKAIFVAFILILSTINFPLWSTSYSSSNNTVHIELFGDAKPAAYQGGNGYDTEALEYHNIIEGINQRSINPSLETTIAIIDTGIDESVWNKLENDYSVDISFIHIREFCVERNIFLFCTEYYIGNEFIDNPAYFRVDDPLGHGNWVTSVVAQVAPGSKIIVINMSDHDDPAYRLRGDFISKAYEVVYNSGNPIADVVSMSYGAPGGGAYSESDQNLITNMAYAGVQLFAAIGNNNIDEVAYPASYCGVSGISAFYDDVDGNMVNGDDMPSGYVGARVSSDKTANLLHGERGPWGSSYGLDVMYSAAGFDIEVWGEGPTAQVVDGTSFAAPIVAGVALHITDLLIEQGYGLTVSPGDGFNGVMSILMSTAEGSFLGYSEGSYLEYVVKPTMGSNPLNLNYDIEFGYGAVDLYDALIFAAMEYGKPTVSILNPSSTTVSGNVLIQALPVDDQNAISHVEFYINNALMGTDFSSTYEYNWNTNYYPNNSVIKVIVYDDDGKMGVTQMYVWVSNSGGGHYH